MTTKEQNPSDESSILLSILIPVRDDSANLQRVLDALRAQDLSECELLVCDDGSQTPLERADLKADATFVRLEGKGPAAARNHLARQARGLYLLFLDADTLPTAEMLGCIRTILAENPGIQAFFGSYDDDPQDRSSVSTLKNLAHHNTHQESSAFVATFWCGCGVIQRRIFLEMGGFDESFQQPSIEDIDLGLRLATRGIPIRVFPDLQVKHLKRWTFMGWVYTDFFLRGLPWVRLMRSRRTWEGQLNFSWKQRLSAVSAAAIVVALPATVFWSAAWLIVFLGSAFFLYLNRRFFLLVLDRRGFLLGLLAIPFQLLYSCICITALVVGVVWPEPRSSPAGESRKPPLQGRDIG